MPNLEEDITKMNITIENMIANVKSKIDANKIDFYIKRIMHYNEVRFIPGRTCLFNIKV